MRHTREILRQNHHAGEKLFADYAGQKPSIVDAATGEVIAGELFVAVLGASNYTYAEATLTQPVPDFYAVRARVSDTVSSQHYRRAKRYPLPAPQRALRARPAQLPIVRCSISSKRGSPTVACTLSTSGHASFPISGS